MKCWPGWARVASMTTWYSVIAAARFVRVGLRRSSAHIVSSLSKTLRKPQVSWGSMAARRSPAFRPPTPATSPMKRLKKTAWRASSACWVARKYFCSSSGAASM
jgi:hypothetical protein